MDDDAPRCATARLVALVIEALKRWDKVVLLFEEVRSTFVDSVEHHSDGVQFDNFQSTNVHSHHKAGSCSLSGQVAAKLCEEEGYYFGRNCR